MGDGWNQLEIAGGSGRQWEAMGDGWKVMGSNRGQLEVMGLQDVAEGNGDSPKQGEAVGGGQR